MHHKGKILVAAAIALAALGMISDPRIAIALFAVAVFLFSWGAARAQTETVIEKLPAGSRILSWLHVIEAKIWPESTISEEKRRHVYAVLSGLSLRQRAIVRRCMITGHGQSIDDEDWHPLESVGLLWRNYTGKQGIKPNVLPVVEQYFGENWDRELRVAIKDILARFIQDGQKLATQDADDGGLVDRWSTQLNAFVTDALGEGEATQLFSHHGYVFYKSQRTGKYYNRIEGILRRLNELIGRIDTVSMRQDFDILLWNAKVSEMEYGSW